MGFLLHSHPQQQLLRQFMHAHELQYGHCCCHLVALSPLLQLLAKPSTQSAALYELLKQSQHHTAGERERFVLPPRQMFHDYLSNTSLHACCTIDSA